MYYIHSWSGGKDSTASIILAHEHNEPIDFIVFSEVMYDDNISGENPLHIDFIKNVAKPLFESWGYKVLILRAETNYLDNFHKIIEKPRIHTEHKGMKRGFPVTGHCCIQRDLKLKPMKDFYKNLDGPIMEYVGVCTDEKKRLESLYKKPNKISLLDKYGYTEDMARELCLQYGLLSPGYDYSKRQGCWFCPNSRMEEKMAIKRIYPEIWSQFVKLEDEPNIAGKKYSLFSKSLQEIDELI